MLLASKYFDTCLLLHIFIQCNKIFLTGQHNIVVTIILSVINEQRKQQCNQKGKELLWGLVYRAVLSHSSCSKVNSWGYERFNFNSYRLKLHRQTAAVTLEYRGNIPQFRKWKCKSNLSLSLCNRNGCNSGNVRFFLSPSLSVEHPF
jgi:hypothetical protein